MKFRGVVPFNFPETKWLVSVSRRIFGVKQEEFDEFMMGLVVFEVCPLVICIGWM